MMSVSLHILMNFRGRCTHRGTYLYHKHTHIISYQHHHHLSWIHHHCLGQIGLYCLKLGCVSFDYIKLTAVGLIGKNLWTSAEKMLVARMHNFDAGLCFLIPISAVRSGVCFRLVVLATQYFFPGFILSVQVQEGFVML